MASSHGYGSLRSKKAKSARRHFLGQPITLYNYYFYVFIAVVIFAPGGLGEFEDAATTGCAMVAQNQY